MTHFVVVWNRQLGFTWGRTVRADRATIVDGQQHFFDGEKLVYQVPVALVARVEEHRHHRAAEEALQAAHRRTRATGAGSGALTVEEVAEPPQRGSGGGGFVESRHFTVEGRIIPRPKGGG